MRFETNPPISQTGNSIRITVPQDDWLRRHISISYELVGPRETRLRAHTGSGALVDLRTGSGSVRIE